MEPLSESIPFWALRFCDCNFQLLGSIISLCMFKIINKFGSRTQNNKASITLLNCNMTYMHRHSNSVPPFFPHFIPPTIMVGIVVWKYIFEPFIHILQHFVLQLSRSTNFCFSVQMPLYLNIRN